MEKVVAFVDGFNIYHSIIDKKLNHLKWLDYQALAQAFIKHSSQHLKFDLALLFSGDSDLIPAIKN